MNARIPQIIQQLKQQGTPLKKLHVALKLDEMIESLEAQGLMLQGLQTWLNQAPEIFLKYQEKTENRCNLRDLQEWLNYYWDQPPISLEKSSAPSSPKPTAIIPPIETNSPPEPPEPENSAPKIEYLPPLSEKTAEEEEEDWDRILKELEDLESSLLEENSSPSQNTTPSDQTQTRISTLESESHLEYFLRRKKEIQGPYHFTRVLRYIEEGRLPKMVEFSLDKEHWESIAHFPHKSDLKKIELFDAETSSSVTTKTALVPQNKISQTHIISIKQTQILKKEILESKKENLVPEEFWLRQKGDVQGPYHYKRILRYIREGRLPHNTEFSFDRQKWEDIEFFPYSLDEDETAQAASLYSIELTQKGASKHETGLLNAEDGNYQGDIQNDIPHGQGDIRFPDGSTYSGGFRDGRFNGRGCFAFPDGGQYEGDWFDGNMNGLGKLTDAKGNVYNGRWVHGEQTGLGTLSNVEGLSYVGEFKDGKFHGWGTYTWPTGQTYVGEFNEGEFHGEGTLTIPTLFGKKTQAGLWEYGDYVGATKEFAEATKTYKREARLGNKLAQKRLKELGIKWNY